MPRPPPDRRNPATSTRCCASISSTTTPTARTAHCINARPRATLRHTPVRSSGRYDVTGSAASSMSTCRAHEVTRFSAPTGPLPPQGGAGGRGRRDPRGDQHRGRGRVRLYARRRRRPYALPVRRTALRRDGTIEHPPRQAGRTNVDAPRACTSSGRHSARLPRIRTRALAERGWRYAHRQHGTWTPPTPVNPHQLRCKGARAT
jgi:hypothetical protein